MAWKEGDPLPDLEQMREWLREGAAVDWERLCQALRGKDPLLEFHFAHHAPVFGGKMKRVRKATLLGDIGAMRCALAESPISLSDLRWEIGIAWSVRQPEMGEYLEGVARAMEAKAKEKESAK